MSEFRRRTAGDEGFSLLEVVVSMLLFAVLSTAVVGIVIRTVVVSGNAGDRTTAANLAERQKEFLLATASTNVVSGTSAVVVDGRTYTVQTLVSDSGLGAVGDQCQQRSDSKAFYKRVLVTVTWPNMGSTTPVRNEAFRQMPMTQAQSTGALTVTVKDGDGNAVPNVTVVLVGSGGADYTSQASDDYGCVVFSSLPAASYSARVDQAGYVGIDNVQRKTLPAVTSVNGSITALGGFVYARSGSAVITLPDNLGAHSVPAGLGAGVRSLSYSTTATNSAIGATGGRIDGLFPADYTAWGGLCQDSAGSVGQTARVPAGGEVTMPVALQKVDLGFTVDRRVSDNTLVSSTDTTPAGTVTNGIADLTGITVHALHSNGNGCDSGQDVPLYQGSTTATATPALPPGTWQLVLVNSAGQAFGVGSLAIADGTDVQQSVDLSTVSGLNLVTDLGMS